MISKGIQFWYLYSALVALVLIRIIPFVYPDSRTWGFNHLIFLPSDYSVLFFCLAIVALLLPFVKKSEIWGGEFVDWFSNIFFESPRKYIYRVVLILSITALFIIFSAKTHFLGDGYEVINNISSGDGSFFKWSALGITFLLKILNQVLGADGNQTAILAIQIVSYLSGILSIWFYFLIAEYISEIKVQRIIMFLVLLFSGSLLLFFGYAENYPSLLIAVSGMIYGGLKYIKTGRGLSIMWLFAILGVVLHLQMFILVPGAVYLTFFTGDRGIAKQKYRKFILGSICFISIGFIGYLAYKYYTDLFYQIMFLDILSIGSDNAVFSMAHILDIFNETILISPIILLFLVSIGKIKKTDVKRNGLIFLGLITCGFLIFFVFINPQLGMPRDWDLFSPAPVIITLLLVLLIKRNYLNSYKQIILPILIILLLSPLPYLLTNLNHATSAKYAEYFCSLDLKKSSATLFLLHKYYEEKGNTEKYQEIKDILVDNLATQEKLDSALLAINNGNLNFATEILKRIEPDQYDANYQRVLWKLNFAQGDYEKAMKYIENAIQLNKYNSNLYGDRAKSYMARRDYNKALENLRHGYSLDNSNIYIIDGLVSTYFYLNQYDSTIFYAQKRLVLDPSEAYIHYMLAKSFANKNDLNMAQKYYNKFAEFNIDHPGYKSKLNELSELIKILNAGK